MALSRPGRLLPVFFLPSNHRGLRRGKTHENSEPPMTLSYKLILTLFSAAFAASLIACFFRFPATAGGIEESRSGCFIFSTW